MALSSKICQSCGMPLKRDAQGGGTNADGSRNLMYCSHCYLQGEFTMPYLKVDDMKARVKIKMLEMGVPGFMTGFFTRNIPKLNRWRKG
ncbi:MAG: zinc ribbon domain-containing protein [Bacteroidia bacterium]